MRHTLLEMYYPYNIAKLKNIGNYLSNFESELSLPTYFGDEFFLLYESLRQITLNTVVNSFMIAHGYDTH